MNLGEIIYMTVKPIFKIYFILATGFILARKNILTVESSKSLSNIAIKALIPCLTFDKIVSNISNIYVHQIATIVIISFVMQILGGAICFLFGYFIRVPRNWWGGLISCGALANISDLPIAYLDGFLNSKLFDDVDIGISYVIIFLVLQMLTQFNMGLYKLIEMDFKNEMQFKIEDENKNGELLDSVSNIIINDKSQVDDKFVNDIESKISKWYDNKCEVKESEILQKVKNFFRSDEIKKCLQKNNSSNKKKESCLESFKKFQYKKHCYSMIKLWRGTFIQPSSISVVLSIMIAMIPWLQALFIDTKQAYIPSAPDNQPPLSFILDFAGYLGSAQVPLGLLLLGATIGRIDLKKMERGIWKAPLVLTLVKLIIFPIIGCAFNSGLNKANLFYGQKILYFLCNISFGLPSATSIIYVTAMYLPTLDKRYFQMDVLALLYIFQYTILVVSLPFLATYTIKISLEL